MNSPDARKKNRRILFLIVFLCLSPFVIATVLYLNPDWIRSGASNGNLIDPAFPTSREEFQGFDDFSRQNMNQVRGRWVLVHFIRPTGCNESCVESLDKTRRIRLMLNKDLMRVRRMAVVLQQQPINPVNAAWNGDTYLLRARAVSRIVKAAREFTGAQTLDGFVFLMDPSGNLLMWYEPDADPYSIKKDLKRLLRVSRIG